MKDVLTRYSDDPICKGLVRVKRKFSFCEIKKEIVKKVRYTVVSPNESVKLKPVYAWEGL